MSVNWIKPFDPDRLKLKVPGNNFSLYLALSGEITQKLLPVIWFVPSPKVNEAFSSSNTKVLYWPYIVVVADLKGTEESKLTPPPPFLLA